MSAGATFFFWWIPRGVMMPFTPPDPPMVPEGRLLWGTNQIQWGNDFLTWAA